MNRKKVEKYLADTVGIDVAYRGFDVLVDCILLVSKDVTKYRQGYTTKLFDEILALPRYSDNSKMQISSWLVRTVKTAANNKYKNLSAKKFIFLAVIEIGG